MGREKYLQFNNKESKIYMPNEIFEDLQNNIKTKIHIPVAYSYYYLISWLYRYAKYSIPIDNKNIKEVLGYHPDLKGLDYIMKTNGLMDFIGYTETTKDYPMQWTFENENLEFEMISHLDNETQKYIKGYRSRKYNIKCPVKAFSRMDNSDDLDGTYYDISNTHLIPFEVFLYCMNNKDIGCTGFYLYSYLKMMNQIYTNGYDISMDKLTENTGLDYSTMYRSLDTIRQYKMVEGIHNQEYFSIGLEDRKANTYISNEIESFTLEPITYEKMKVLEIKDHKQLIEEKSAQHILNIKLEDLPF